MSDAEQRREDDRHEPGHDERDGDDGKQRERVFAGRACGKADRNEAGDRDQRAGQHGEGIGAEGERRGLTLSSPCASRVSMASVVVMASSTSNASAMMSAPSEMRCMSMPASSMSEKTMASVSGMASAITRPGPNAEADEAHRQNDRDRLPQRRHELGDRALDRHRLIGDQFRLDAERQIGGDLAPSPS